MDANTPTISARQSLCACDTRASSQRDAPVSEIVELLERDRYSLSPDENSPEYRRGWNDHASHVLRLIAPTLRACEFDTTKAVDIELPLALRTAAQDGESP